MSPAQLRTTAARVSANFFRGRPHYLATDLGIHAGSLTELECFLAATVLTGMKRENGDAASCFQAERQIPQQRLERTEFVIDGDTQCLEYPSNRVLVAAGGTDNGCQIGRG